MKKIKIIDLINACNSGDRGLPKKIKWKKTEYTRNFLPSENIFFYCNGLGSSFIHDLHNFCDLKSEVEIIEEEKIEKIPLIIHKDGYKMVDCDALQYKIDQLIDKVNELDKKVE